MRNAISSNKKIELAQWLIDPDKALELPADWNFLEKKLKENGLEKVLYEIELPLAPILDDMKRIGVKVDLKALERLAKELNEKLADLEKKIYDAAGLPFNINSPKQLSEILFERLKIDSAGVPKRKTGAFSTDAETLLKIKNRHQIVTHLLDYREIFKIKSTYADPLQELVAKDGRIHTTFVQTATGTGRLSSQNPNLQNIPILSERGKKLREAFIAEKRYSFAALDYSQIELRVLASVAQDAKMIEAFQNDLDIHKITAANVFNAPMEKVTPEMRHLAKTLNFGVIYGMGADAFARTSGVSRTEAQKFIREYFSDFADIKRWQEKTISMARQAGYVETLNGRKRWLTNIMSPNPRLRAEAERMAINMPIQGLAADIIKLAMIRVNKVIQEKRWQEKVRMLLSIHDELLFEIEDDILQKAVDLIKSEMENAYTLAIPIKVDVAIGKNWAEV